MHTFTVHTLMLSQMNTHAHMHHTYIHRMRRKMMTRRRKRSFMQYWRAGSAKTVGVRT